MPSLLTKHCHAVSQPLTCVNAISRHLLVLNFCGRLFVERHAKLVETRYSSKFLRRLLLSKEFSIDNFRNERTVAGIIKACMGSLLGT